MHEDEIDISVDLVHRLLVDQFPQWSSLPIERLPSAGTENAMFRVGDGLLARLPRIHWAADAPNREFRWLPRLAPGLPLATPVPLALGEPGRGYPWQWLVVEWLPGENAHDAPPADTGRLALDLAAFVNSLHSIEAPVGAPGAGRGQPLVAVDHWVQEALTKLDDDIDVPAAKRTWERLVATSVWQGPPKWIHGDLTRTNLLVREGRLSAVIDFAGLGVGDPAADMIPAWAVLDGEDRAAFRLAVGVDEATWSRGQGWALAPALIAVPYYRHSNPVIVEYSRKAISTLVTD